MDYDLAQVNTGGRIFMSASFESMREPLTTLKDAIPNIVFLSKWLKGKLGKEKGGGGQRSNVRGRRGRGGYMGQYGSMVEVDS